MPDALMSQLVNDPPRGDARVRGSVAVQTRLRCSAPVGQAVHVHRRRFVNLRIVDRRHHRDYVDRNVDRAGRRRHLFRRQPALVSMPSVSTTSAARCSSRRLAAMRGDVRRLLHGVIKRRLAERRVHRLE